MATAVQSPGQGETEVGSQRGKTAAGAVAEPIDCNREEWWWQPEATVRKKLQARKTAFTSCEWFCYINTSWDHESAFIRKWGYF